jgi:mono/diheme cytochrome c family protein
VLVSDTWNNWWVWCTDPVGSPETGVEEPRPRRRSPLLVCGSFRPRMLSTIDFLVAGLSTGNKIGLAAVAAAFIIFALVSSFLLPRRNPNFPGRAVGWYSALAVLFLIAMISAVLVFGKESEESTAGESTPSNPNTLPVATAPAPETAPTPATTTEDNGGGGNGDAAAGKAVFASAGCGGCHTLKAAGASGNVGPNLDQLHPDFDAVHDQVEHGGGGMPAFKGELSDEQIANVAAFVANSTG